MAMPSREVVIGDYQRITLESDVNTIGFLATFTLPCLPLWAALSRESMLFRFIVKGVTWLSVGQVVGTSTNRELDEAGNYVSTCDVSVLLHKVSIVEAS